VADNSNPLPGFIQGIIGGVARHMLTGIAGGLAVSAGLTSNQQAQLISGGAAVVVWCAGVAWSMLEKHADASQRAAAITDDGENS
jgi:hypothetical protein